jgi:exopolysaccharide biosynthesis protein
MNIRAIAPRWHYDTGLRSMGTCRLIFVQLLACAIACATLSAQVAQPTWRTVSPGVEHAKFVRGSAGPDGLSGPWPINLLRIDPALATIDVVHAMDEGVGLETVSSMASRTGAIVAVNAGYFRTTGTFRGESQGLLQIDGVLLSEADRGRAAAGFVRSSTAADATTTLVLGHATTDVSLRIAGERRDINGINRPVGDNELILFSSSFHRTTLTAPGGLEVTVRRGLVEAIHDGAGSTPIPPDGVVLSARGASRLWLLAQAKPGSAVTVSELVRPVDQQRDNPWTRAEDIVGGGPRIVSAGREDITLDREKVLPSFSTDRHPRTAIGALADGRILLATVDGRRPPLSVGMTLSELARLMIEFGATDAINLDGGGSTTMVVEGKVVNTPSDAAGERPVSDAIVVRIKR